MEAKTPYLGIDAYGTAQVLYTLHELGVSASAAQYRRAVQYLPGTHPQNRDVPENHSHSKPHLSKLTAKPDISTWRSLGHFYLALTHAERLAGHWSARPGLIAVTARVRCALTPPGPVSLNLITYI